MSTPVTIPDPYQKIAASEAARIFRWDYRDLCEAIDAGTCRSYPTTKDRRYTCRAYVREYLDRFHADGGLPPPQPTKRSDEVKPQSWRDYTQTDDYRQATGRA